MAQADSKYERNTEPYAKAARWDAVKDRLVNAAQSANVDAATLARIAAFESSFKSDARPVSKSKPQLNIMRQFDGTMALSTAYGYGQFLDDAWTDSIRRYGEKYGIPGAKTMTAADAAAYRNNQDIQAAMLAEFTKDNIDKGRAIGGANDDADVYALHNLGSTGGPRFLKGLVENPNARVNTVLGPSVIHGNSTLYGDGTISIGDAYSRMESAMASGNVFAQEASRMQKAKAN